jgi:hypothetical protein
MTTDNECPPPEMTSRPDGSMHYRPHCWKCAPKVKQLNEASRPAPVTTGQRTKAGDWRTDDIARFVIETCQGFGHTLDWLIENYSATTTTGTITASKAPDEFQRRLNNLYTMMPKLREAVSKLTKHQMHLPRQFIACGVRQDGKANHAALLQVLPIEQHVVI